MDDSECKTLNRFIDHYDEMTDSHLVEGCTGSADAMEITVLNVAISAVLTIKDLMED